LQICGELRDLAEFKPGVRIAVVYGGQPIDRQIAQLKKKPQIVVATPGRLMDHYKRRTIRLDQVQTVVLDECDRMLDMGFVRDVTRILDLMPRRRNLALMSATISREVMDIAWVYQRDAVEDCSAAGRGKQTRHPAIPHSGSGQRQSGRARSDY
jgi:ATP-dependent RNA helicase DeaD